MRTNDLWNQFPAFGLPTRNSQRNPMFLEQSERLRSDPQRAATYAGLRYVSDEGTRGIARVPHGKGFSYRGLDGRSVDKSTAKRIRSLAIPPAWTSVWISPFPDAHLAATGRDAKGRKQYRYNPEFLQIRNTAKFGHLIAFAEVLPKIRKAVNDHMAMRGLPREKVIATIISLLEQTNIRIGNEGYAKENGSFGLTTLRNKHVRVAGSELRFLFKGKSGKTWRLSISNRRVAKVIRACQELPGQNLFQYEDDNGELQKVTSGDVNDYLREVGERDITAKDFRTWAGTVLAAIALSSLEGPPLKKHVRDIIAHVANQLGNTATICRKCYVHPEILAAYEADELKLNIREAAADSEPGLDAGERAVLRYLKSRATNL
jgi:DNA topoisomerase-1